MLKKSKFYSLSRIIKRDAQYNIIIGERSNGKTYAVLKYALDEFVKSGHQLGIIRRWQDDFKGKRGQTMFDSLVSNGEITKATKGEYTGIYYQSSRWYLMRLDEKNEKILSEKPFAYAFSISSMEHDKSTSYPEIVNILFDEFLTRSGYLPDEFVLYMNVLSTIIRHRNNVRIFMCGNTVNKYSPYFTEMGLTNITKMQKGDIDVYEYGQSGLRVAVEYSDNPQKDKPSDVYFAFDNPKLSMITGKGQTWEINIYPHCPCKYTSGDIVYVYFIMFNGDTLQCDIVNVENTLFTYIHRKTTPIKDDNRDLVFTPEHSHKRNYARKITKPITPLQKKIAEFYIKEKVFYQDNEIGEIVRNYLLWCKGDRL